MDRGHRCHYLNGDIRLRQFHLPTVFKMARLLREQQIDVVMGNRHTASVYATLGAWLAGTPAVLTHVHGMKRCRNWRRRLLYRLISRRITWAVGCADAVRQDIVDTYPGLSKKARSLVNSVDYDRFHYAVADRKAMRDELGIDQDAFVFLFPARLVEKKGHHFLLDAFVRVLEKHLHAHLLLVGEGRLRLQIEQYARQLGVHKRVSMPGFRSDIDRIMKISDALVLSSEREGMPIAILEAMASGLLVIATGEGGVRESLDNGAAGFYVYPRTHENFVAAMFQAIDLSPQQYREMVGVADQRVRQHYHHAVVAKELEKLFEQSLGQTVEKRS